MHLDRQHPQPIYLQLKEMLQRQIEQGVYVSHQKLPSERDLSYSYGLSRMTARRALKALIADGYAYTRVGKGTFVYHQAKTAKNILSTDPGQTKAIPKTGLIDPQLCQDLLNALISFDCIKAEETIEVVLSQYSLEIVAGVFFPEVIRCSEQKWSGGSINLVAHNFAIVTIRSQLISMMNASTITRNGPKALLLCAPDDLHEVGLTILALNLKRRGMLIVYLGTSLTGEGFYHAVETANPELICVSAATDRGVENFFEMGRRLSSYHDREDTVLTYGGVAFSNNPVLTESMPGTYLGATINDAVDKVQSLTGISEQDS